MIGLSNTLSRIREFLEKYTLYKSNDIAVSFNDLGYTPDYLEIENPNRLITEQDKELILNQLKRTVPGYYESLEVILRELKTKYSKCWLEYKKCLDKTVKIESVKKEWRKMQEWKGKKWGKKGFFESAKILPMHLWSWRKIEEHYRIYSCPNGNFYNWELYWVDWMLEKHPELIKEFDVEGIKSYLNYKFSQIH